jgi:hypothetical protein
LLKVFIYIWTFEIMTLMFHLDTRDRESIQKQCGNRLADSIENNQSSRTTTPMGVNPSEAAISADQFHGGKLFSNLNEYVPYLHLQSLSTMFGASTNTRYQKPTS